MECICKKYNLYIVFKTSWQLIQHKTLSCTNRTGIILTSNEYKLYLCMWLSSQCDKSWIFCIQMHANPNIDSSWWCLGLASNLHVGVGFHQFVALVTKWNYNLLLLKGSLYSAPDVKLNFQILLKIYTWTPISIWTK